MIQGIGESSGEAEGEGDERSIGLVELEDIVDACPSMDVSAGPGESANVSATYADMLEETFKVRCNARRYLIAEV